MKKAGRGERPRLPIGARILKTAAIQLYGA
jgi:hypothetical protein